ncbi:MAG: cobalamin B12-binding domain-containing protein [Deltaproteobacteria bacterium]|nr:cobalamin B12-binding domain-containing protein [Deltaproteobacteria bacterium]
MTSAVGPRVLFIIKNVLIGSDPLGIMHLSSYVKAESGVTDLCVVTDDYLARIAEFRPDLIAFSLMSVDYPAIREAARAIKARYPKIPVIAGGPHVTYQPECVTDLGIEAVCKGEGDYPFIEVLQRLKNGKDFSGIPNLDTPTQKNPLGRLVESLDELPFVDRLPFYCLIRPDRISEDMVRLLKEAGCGSICMSIETGNEKLRRDVMLRPVTNEKMIRSFELFRKHGIRTYTNTILGVPCADEGADHWQHDLDSLDINLKCKPDYFSFTICTPYIGTDIHKYCVKHDLLEKNAGLENAAPDMFDYSVINQFTPELKRRQKNLSTLGPLVVKFPFLRGLVVNYLVKLPPNPLFELTSFIVLNYQIRKYVIPLKYSLRDTLTFVRSLARTKLASLRSHGARSATVQYKGWRHD